jgi:hypothetical protein
MFQERCRMRVTENRVRREPNGRRHSPSLSVAHSRVIPRLAEHMVITSEGIQALGNFVILGGRVVGACSALCWCFT